MKNSNIGTWLSLAFGGLLVCASCKQSETPVPSAEPVQTSVAALKVGDSTLRQLSKEQLAERLIQASAGDKLGLQIFDQIMAQFSQSGMVKPELVEKLRAKTNPTELVKLIVPVYTKHLTEGEMIAMIEFYETPTGKSVVSKLPLIAQESMMVGQTWGANLAQTLVSEIQNAASAAGAGAPGATPTAAGGAARAGKP
jgi:hypothetical protein